MNFHLCVLRLLSFEVEFCFRREFFRTEGAPIVAGVCALAHDGLQQAGERYGERLVEVSQSDGSKLERVSNSLNDVSGSACVVEEEECLTGHLRCRSCFWSTRIGICSPFLWAAAA